MTVATDNCSGTNFVGIGGRTTTTGGLTWSVLNGTWVTNNNTIVKTTTVDNEHAVVDPATTVHEISAICHQNTPGLTVRVVDTSNFYTHFMFTVGTSDGAGLYKCVAGTYTQLGSLFSWSANDTRRGCRANGTTIEAYGPSGVLRSVTDTAHQSATRCGLRGDASVATMWFDDVEITYTAVGSTGTAAVTEGTDTSAASGSTVKGTAAASETADTSTTAGTVYVGGTSATTEVTDTPTIDGNHLVASGTALEEADAGVAAGVVNYSGLSFTIELSDSVSASGGVNAAGTSAAGEGADTSTVVGRYGTIDTITGTFAWLEERDECEGNIRLPTRPAGWYIIGGADRRSPRGYVSEVRGKAGEVARRYARQQAP